MDQLRQVENEFACKDENSCLASQDADFNGNQEIEKRKGYVEAQDVEIDNQINDSDAHPFWHVVLFLGLITIFFPWSLLVLLFLFGWEGSVQLLRDLVIGSVGIIFVLLWVGIIILATGAVLVWLFG